MRQKSRKKLREASPLIPQRVTAMAIYSQAADDRQQWMDRLTAPLGEEACSRRATFLGSRLTIDLWPQTGVL